MPSFDIVSKVDPQEVDNALNQTRKEIVQRYDFKGTKTEIVDDKDTITITSDDDYKVTAVVDVLQSKFVRRGLSLKSLKYGDILPAGGSLARQIITIQNGIDTDRAKDLVKRLKETKLKVQAQIQADQVRVTGKKRDDLQEAIQFLRGIEFELPLQFINFRD